MSTNLSSLVQVQDPESRDDKALLRWARFDPEDSPLPRKPIGEPNFAVRVFLADPNFLFFRDPPADSAILRWHL